MKKNFLKNAIKIIIVLLWIVVFSFWSYKAINIPPPENVDVGLLPNSHDYFDVYLNNEKIGWSYNAIFANDDGYVLEQRSNMVLKQFGNTDKVITLSYSRLDKDLYLEQFVFGLSAGPISVQASGRMEGDIVKVKVRSGAGQTEEVAIKTDSKGKLLMPTAFPYKIAQGGFNDGDRYTISVFDPLSLSVKPATISVGKAVKKIDPLTNLPIETFQLQSSYLGTTLISWVDKFGRTFEETSQLGLSLVRTASLDEAFEVFGQVENLVDIINIGAVTFTFAPDLSAEQKELLEKQSRKIRKLGLKISETELEDLSGFSLDGDGQSYNNGLLTILVPSFKALKTWPKSTEKDESLQMYLASDSIIEADNSQIKNLAAKIKEQNISKLGQVTSVIGWVYENLLKSPTMGSPKAVDALNLKQGDYLEHAVLATALLRALEIPARPVMGLLYYNNLFYYHAWVEVNLAGKWFPVDPYLGSVPADATHIRLTSGEIQQQIKQMNLMKKLQLEIYEISINPEE